MSPKKRITLILALFPILLILFAGWNLWGEYYYKNRTSYLARQLESGNHIEKLSAAYELSKRMNEPEAVDALVNALNDGNSDVRKDVIFGLAMHKSHNRRLLDAIKDTLDDKDKDVRRSAANILADNPQYLKENLDAVKKIYSNPSGEFSLSASLIMNELKLQTPEYIAILAELLSKDDAVSFIGGKVLCDMIDNNPDTIPVIKAAITGIPDTFPAQVVRYKLEQK